MDSQLRLAKSWAIVATHSVGPSASSWWMALKRGLIVSIIAAAASAASTRGPARKVPGVGGGTGSPGSHRSSARLPGSLSSR